MFSILGNFQHRREMRESKDEMLIGEIVRTCATLNQPAIGFSSDAGWQAVRFKPLDDTVLHAFSIQLDRKTGDSALQQAILGSKAVLSFQAEVKNYLADPDDLIRMYRTDLANMFKMPLLGEVKLNHQLNSVYATKRVILDIDQYLSKTDSRAKLQQLIQQNVQELRDKLRQYKK